MTTETADGPRPHWLDPITYLVIGAVSIALAMAVLARINVYLPMIVFTASPAIGRGFLATLIGIFIRGSGCSYYIRAGILLFLINVVVISLAGPNAAAERGAMLTVTVFLLLTFGPIIWLRRARAAKEGGRDADSG